MTKRAFVKRVSNSKGDFLQGFIDILKKEKIPFCVIGGLGVNAYVEPIVSLDLDVVISLSKIDSLVEILKKRFNVKKETHSINIASSSSDLRIQIQRDPKYQIFITKASYRNVLGYEMPVASVEDILQGKIWAYQDKTRRPSKRKKDLTDIMRLVETYPDLISRLPEEIKKEVNEA
ncbi:MAG: nucleotidyl transferase AbiEii/AbiGii toxin family protein [bacterium]